MGRPRFYKTAKAMEMAIEKYFHDAEYDETGIKREYTKHLTMAGLAYFLGFSDRLSLWDYGQRDEFKPCLKRAKLRIESYLENRLYEGNATGAIFNLKNNFGWKDQQSIDVTGKLNALSDEELTAQIKTLLSSIQEKE